jgi:asparagine synthase (glutamine-hydrolysing)
MGDFILNFQPNERRTRASAEFLKFYSDMSVDRHEDAELSVVATSSDDLSIWGGYSSGDGGVKIWLTGRVGMDASEWESAKSVIGGGGLAGKAIWKRFSAGGISAVAELSGNFVIVVYEVTKGLVHLVTDRWGLVPAFRFVDGSRVVAYSSHPDALADAVGESKNWDKTSFAEFVLTGRLTAPNSYYARIKSLPIASITTLRRVEPGKWISEVREYVDFRSRPESENHLEGLAEDFARAFRVAVSRRTNPLFGRSVIGLSGGLDSRTILCASEHRSSVLAFSCYDTENNEFQVAQSIAKAAGVEFMPFQRSMDYYGDSAAMGAKISGGMGCIASNHFLGFRDRLKDLGTSNLITGCYCDYIFKGLALNKRVNPITTGESLGDFEMAYYAGHANAGTDLAKGVWKRLDELFPEDLRRYDTDERVFEVERRRMLPLSYEEDNAERVIPQRVMGWYVPIADNGLLDVYFRMSCAMRMDRRLFGRMVQRVCGDTISNIPDANTGVPVSASLWREALASHWRKVGKVMKKLRPTQSTSGSWLNWGYYASHSPKVRALWERPNPEAFEVFREVLGKDRFSMDISAYRGSDVYVFLQLFTLKLWFDSRS